MKRTFYSGKESAEAGAWLARLQGGELSPQEEARFRQWLATDPTHASAFEHATNVWDRLGAVPREIFVSERPTAPLFSRRALLAGAAGIAVLGSGATFLGRATAKEYHTAIGQQTRLSLPDGSGLFLDTNTKLSVDLSGRSRFVDLQYGRVNCRIAQAERPFAVKAGDSTVVGNRSVFDVQSTDDYFSVILINGNAEVQRSSNPQIALRQGDRITGTRSSSLQRDRPDLSVLTAWQTGRLVFKDDSVADAVEQVNGYSTMKIEVVDADIASLRMSGGYVVGDTFGFAQSLAQLLPIQVRVEDDKIKLIGRPKT